ncbi:chemotaxis protein CheD [Thalassococcus profundi]|uniref:Probable chemoreceptor glutamine deamidase CheD n=1 Tax=Thalassococcus profundi TaxID=2282382 RepID=A0A369TPK2_9RHOB|nr:chemotaxis protein CheD [Thalassococcus profundi]RDD66057.1 chemotaxis protein CheD [Thalassococcus profundi]
MTRPAASERTITVLQGDFAITDSPDEVLSTVLGSCVAVCLFDPVRRIGGMNHFLLPSRDGAAGDDIRYGAYAMELLVNGLLRQGADRTRLAAKVFGGASMNARLRDIGAMNGAFALKFLADEGIPCLSQSLGGTLARRIRFWPVTGQARQLLVPDQGEPAVPRERPAAPPRPAPDVTLF